MNKGFVPATSQNLPRVDLDMLGKYICASGSFQGPELQNVKTVRSMRPNYGNLAIGYVQLKRDGSLCTLEAKICPEHKVRSKNYTVRAVIDEEEERVDECVCQDCAASEDGCKHAVAVLAWMYRKSEEPAPTSVECYWKKPALSCVRSNIKHLTLKDMVAGRGRGSQEPQTLDDSNVKSFLRKILEDDRSKGNNSHLMQFFKRNIVQNLSLHHQALTFTGDRSRSKHFLEFCRESLTPENIEYISRLTSDQSNCISWFEVRYARITASILYDAAKCQTLDGSLVEKILSKNSVGTPAMIRGKQLESQVLLQVERVLKDRQLDEGKIARCGLLLHKDFPALGASPDGLTKTAVVEVKCPSKQKTVKNYHDGERLTNKYRAQIQLQMLFADKRIGYFCIASPDFEKNRKVSIWKEKINAFFTAAVMRGAMQFWEQAMFPRLMQK